MVIDFKKIFKKKEGNEKNEETIAKKKRPGLNVDKEELKKLKLVTVAYSSVKREDFPTKDAFTAEVEVEDRAGEVVAKIKELGIGAKGVRAISIFWPIYWLINRMWWLIW